MEEMMRLIYVRLWVLFISVIVFFALMAGEGFSQQQGCKQVCVKEAVQCLKYGTGCAQYQNQCTSYRNNCISYNRYGGCSRYQQVCAQYKQVCTQTQQICLQQQKVCNQYQTVCPNQPVATPGKAFQQLQEIEKGRDSLFDGGPGSTLNRR